MAVARKFEMGNVLAVAGGGIAGVALQNIVNKVEFFQQNPKIVPLVPTLVGGLMMYFGKGVTSQVGAGMMAVGASNLAGQFIAPLQGWSRVNVNGAADDDEFDRVMAAMSAHTDVIQGMHDVDSDPDAGYVDESDNM